MTKRPTKVRDQLRRVIKRSRPPCHICGQEIDWSAHWLDPLSFTVDHIIPIAKGGANTIENAAASHRACNRAKSDKLMDVLMPAQPLKPFRTSRTWKTPGEGARVAAISRLSRTGGDLPSAAERPAQEAV